MKQLFNVKYVVAIGYLLLFLIAILGLVLMYQEFLDFSEINLKKNERSELIIVGNTLSILYDAENDKSLFNKQLADTYHKKYGSILPIVFNNLDSLKKLTDDTLRITKLDTISTLLEQKKENLTEIIALLDSIEKAPTITRKTVYSTIPPKLNEDIRQYIAEKSQPSVEKGQKDTVIVKKKRKSFLGRLKNVFNAEESADSTIIVNQTSVIESKEFVPVIDTVVNMIRYYERINLERQKKLQYILMNRQMEMGKTNSNLTSRIDDLLKSIEKEELERAIFVLNYKNKAIQSAKRVIFIAAILLLTIGFIFGLLYLRDMIKKQRYRMQLEASNAKINELLTVREKMMYSISHDIKAPLSSILGYIELMHPDIATDKKTLYLDNMKESSEHVLQLVTNLLDYHKLESKKWVLKAINFNLYDLVKNTTNSFAPIATKKKLNWTYKCTIPEDFICHGDPFVLRQIISNLLSNAVKFTFSGGITISAKIVQQKDDFQFDFFVIDTGIGISEKQQKVIFNEFEQLKEDGTEFVEGSGLGLMITKSLITQMDGKLKLKSEKGQGSVFSFTIPLRKGAEKQVNIERIDSIYVDLSDISILVIDDDPLQLKMTEEILLQKKANVTTVSNPSNVLNILTKKQFDILFVDIQMPEINGFELVAQIRDSEIENCKTLPIIALSAKSDIAESAINQSGFTAFLTKPFTMKQLLETIAQKLNRDIEKTDDISQKSESSVERLIDFVREDIQVSREIIESFVENTAPDIQALHKEIEIHNWREAEKPAHKMLPLIKMIGDKECVRILLKLEAQTAISHKESENLLASLQHYIDEAKTFLANNPKTQ